MSGRVSTPQSRLILGSAVENAAATSAPVISVLVRTKTAAFASMIACLSTSRRRIHLSFVNTIHPRRVTSGNQTSSLQSPSK